MTILAMVPITLSNSRVGSIINAAEPSINSRDTITVGISPSKINWGNTSLKRRSISSKDFSVWPNDAYEADGINIDETRQFNFSTNSRLNVDGGSFMLLPSDFYTEFDGDTFYSIEPTGSASNKFRLTNISFVASTFVPSSNNNLAAQTRDLSNPEVTILLQKISGLNETEDGFVSVGDPKLVGGFTANGLNNTQEELNANLISFNQSFPFEDDIQIFTLNSNKPFYYSSLLLQFTIDYGVC